MNCPAPAAMWWKVLSGGALLLSAPVKASGYADPGIGGSGAVRLLHYPPDF